jgi:hypothetical protein
MWARASLTPLRSVPQCLVIITKTTFSKIKKIPQTIILMMSSINRRILKFLIIRLSNSTHLRLHMQILIAIKIILIIFQEKTQIKTQIA